MATDGVLRRVHSGSAPDPVSWESLAAIFDTCFGVDVHGLPKWPDSMDTIAAGWIDGEGRRFTANVLSDLEAAYREARTAVLHFSGHRHEGARCDFEYWPGDPRPRARLAVEGTDEDVEAAIAATAAAFPLPFQGALIFLSWGGDRSRRVAETLGALLRRRFPAAEAAQRPWVIWETAAAWARGQLVIPVFVDVKPADVPGPLTHRVQGIDLSHRAEVDRILRVIARRLAFAEPDVLSDDEHQSLLETLAS